MITIILLVFSNLAAAAKKIKPIPHISRDDIACGQQDEPCCTYTDVEDAFAALGAQVPPAAAPGPDYERFDPNFCWNKYRDICYEGICTYRKDLPCGQLAEPCCDVEAIGSSYISECFNYDLFCVDGTCTARGDLNCGGFEEPCCNPAEYNDQKCFYDLKCIDDLCQGVHVLDCGGSGERCCTPLDKKGIFNYYNYYDDGSCFYPAKCTTDGICTECNSDGDKCCEDINQGTFWCQGSYSCIEGECKACGELGQQCCPQDNDSYYSSPSQCQGEIDCLNGVCQYCGYHQAACCGLGGYSSCKLNDLTCVMDTMTCELCGQKDEPCCGDFRCADEYLQCIEGTCVCGGDGQRCCDGFCDDGFLCNQYKMCEK